MCIICVEIFKQKLTVSEARRNLMELIGTEESDKDFEHHVNLLDAIENDDSEVLESIANGTIDSLAEISDEQGKDIK